MDEEWIERNKWFITSVIMIIAFLIVALVKLPNNSHDLTTCESINFAYTTDASCDHERITTWVNTCVGDYKIPPATPYSPQDGQTDITNKNRINGDITDNAIKLRESCVRKAKEMFCTTKTKCEYISPNLDTNR